MSYSDKRDIHYTRIGAAVADDAVVDYIIIPATREMEIYAVKSVTINKSPTASAKIELINGASVLSSVSITQNNGTVAVGSGTFPMRVVNTGATDAVLKIQADKASGAGCDVVVEVHHQYVPLAPA